MSMYYLKVHLSWIPCLESGKIGFHSLLKNSRVNLLSTSFWLWVKFNFFEIVVLRPLFPWCLSAKGWSFFLEGA